MHIKDESQIRATTTAIEASAKWNVMRERQYHFFLWHVNLFSFVCLYLSCRLFFRHFFSDFYCNEWQSRRFGCNLFEGSAIINAKHSFYVVVSYWHKTNTTAGWNECFVANKGKANERFMDTCECKANNIWLLNRSTANRRAYVLPLPKHSNENSEIYV